MSRENRFGGILLAIRPLDDRRRNYTREIIGADEFAFGQTTYILPICALQESKGVYARTPPHSSEAFTSTAGTVPCVLSKSVGKRRCLAEARQ